MKMSNLRVGQTLFDAKKSGSTWHIWLVRVLEVNTNESGEVELFSASWNHYPPRVYRKVPPRWRVKDPSLKKVRR